MRTILLSAIFIFSMMNSAWAMKCWQRPGIEGYKDAERVFLIYVTQTRIDEKLGAQLSEIYSSLKDENQKAIYVDYHIVEEFKGNSAYKPVLADLLYAGGHLGVVSGHYYLVKLGSPRKEMKDVRVINTCNVPLQSYRLNENSFQNELEAYRKFRDSELK